MCTSFLLKKNIATEQNANAIGFSTRPPRRNGSMDYGFFEVLESPHRSIVGIAVGSGRLDESRFERTIFQSCQRRQSKWAHNRREHLALGHDPRRSYELAHPSQQFASDSKGWSSQRCHSKCALLDGHWDLNACIDLVQRAGGWNCDIQVGFLFRKAFRWFSGIPASARGYVGSWAHLHWHPQGQHWSHCIQVVSWKFIDSRFLWRDVNRFCNRYKKVRLGLCLHSETFQLLNKFKF